MLRSFPACFSLYTLLIGTAVAGCTASRKAATPPTSGPTQAERKAAHEMLRRRRIPFRQKAFRDSVYANNLPVVRQFLQAGIKPNVPYDTLLTRRGHEDIQRKGMTVLMKAILRGQATMADALLQAGANPNAKFSQIVSGKSNTWYALHIAAGRGKERIVRSLLEARAKPNVRDSYGLTPLLYAARAGRTQIADILLDAGANPDAQTQEKKTALIVAAEQGYPDIARLLIDRGAQPGIRDRLRRTALVVALSQGHTETASLLLKVDHTTSRKLLTGWLLEFTKAGKTKIVQLLLEKGARPDVMDRDKATALINAAEKGYRDIVKALLKAGADPNARDATQATALMYAARAGHTGIVRLLLKNGANVHLKDENGQTALKLLHK